MRVVSEKGTAENSCQLSQYCCLLAWMAAAYYAPNFEDVWRDIDFWSFACPSFHFFITLFLWARYLDNYLNYDLGTCWANWGWGVDHLINLKKKKNYGSFVWVISLVNLSFYRDKHIGGGIVFHKHISGCCYGNASSIDRLRQQSRQAGKIVLSHINMTH